MKTRFQARPVFLKGHRLQLLCGSTAYFPTILNAIGQAQQSLHLETYLFNDDEVGNAVAQALMAAARRGVRTRVLVDGFGGRAFVDTLKPLLQIAGVEVMIYRPEKIGLRFRRHRLRRLHRKILCIDGQIAFIGGINITEDHAFSETGFHDLDYAVRVEGPLVEHVVHDTEHLWQRLCRVRFGLSAASWSRKRPSVGTDLGSGVSNAEHLPWGVKAAWVIRDNLGHRHDIENAYLEAMEKAKNEIIIACAYFLPGRRFREALLAAARRGVRIILILQGLTDHPLQRHATRALYPMLLKEGITLFEYDKAFLHAKVAIIDRYWATVGSSNIDPFSLFLAKEANVIIQDKVFARHLRTALLNACHEGGVLLRKEAWHARPRLGHLSAWLAYGLTRLAWGLTGFAEH
jgi:cardiolipin synthase A/B